jgi:glycogen phosphorylase
LWGCPDIGDLRIKINADHHVFEVEIFLNDLDPKAVRVELYADGINGGIPVRPRYYVKTKRHAKFP